MKYELPESESEVLPNIPGYTLASDIAIAEFEGFLKAEILLTEALDETTKFDLEYILQIHKLALDELYTFAGKYRNVNISKGGFPFAAARFLPETMKSFDDEILKKQPDNYTSKESLIKDIATVHAELLFIHPFREGNGRTARILANLMSRKHGFGALRFDKIGAEEMNFYIAAVQKAANKEYGLMTELISSVFPG